MTVLLTRARPQAEATAERLRARGMDSLIAPLVRIEAVARMPYVLSGPVQAILVTSHNGAMALATHNVDRLAPVLAVGNRTATTLHDAGFGDVRSANGDAADLAALALATLDLAKGCVVHARGETVTRSPLASLRAAGFETAEAILYKSITIPQFGAETIPCLATVDTALVYSPDSAQRLHDALAALPMRTLPPLHFLAISPAALAPLRGSTLAAGLHVASHPSEDALLSLLDKIPKNPVALPENRR